MLKKSSVLVVLAMVFAMVFFACGDGSEGGGEESLNKIGDTITSPKSGMILTWVPAGTFIMGSNDAEAWEAFSPHQVTINQGFFMGIYTVTQAQYQAVIETNPSWFKESELPSGSGLTNGNNLPVEMVSWFDALVFCNELSNQEGLTPVYTINGLTATANLNANGYRLPTEAEWEYAAKGGNGMGPYTAFSGSNNSNEVAWHSGNRTHDGTNEVGKLKSNSLGIYDMSGNVVEWCWDWFTIDNARVIRGGSWTDGVDISRLASRNMSTPESKQNYTGFRVVRP